MSHDGRLVATASQDRSVALWNVLRFDNGDKLDADLAALVALSRRVLMANQLVGTPNMALTGAQARFAALDGRWIHEIIYVNDGSSDETLDVLIKAFALGPVERHTRGELKTEPVRRLYGSLTHARLLVIESSFLDALQHIVLEENCHAARLRESGAQVWLTGTELAPFKAIESEAAVWRVSDGVVERI